MIEYKQFNVYYLDYECNYECIKTFTDLDAAVKFMASVILDKRMKFIKLDPVI